MIGVAVLASSPTARARLEALVAAQPGLRLTSPPRPAATSGDFAADAVLGADVLLVDPGARPVETALRACRRSARLPPVMLLADDRARPGFVRLLRFGVRAILPRDASGPEIAAGIEAVAVGLVVLHPSAAPVSVTKVAGAHRARDGTGTGALTPRELEILAMMAEGLRNRAIAQRLGISTHTVKFHIASILDKLNARSRTEAVTTGMRRGVLMV